MNQPRDPDVIIATWLDEGPIDLPEETRRAIVVGLRTQPRARQVAILRGLPVNPIARFATAAAIVLAVGGLSIFVLSNRGGGPGNLPSPSVPPLSTASPSSPTPSSAGFGSTAGWLTFTSSRYGYQIAYPPTWSATAATRDFVLATDRPNPPLDGAADHFLGGAGEQIGVTTFAVDLAPGTTEDDWLSAYFNADPDPNCRANLAAMAVTTVDGHPGRIWTSNCFDSQAFVLVDTRIHVFSIWREKQEPLLRAFLSTVRFQTVSPSGIPGPS
ncbi:MAG TPA: hypothetical protein VFY18_08585 [Candidatus Limnocylindrales bacterium]|nr:hypothetical protein [Candidatus Limnocylindrales bacterium]